MKAEAFGQDTAGPRCLARKERQEERPQDSLPSIPCISYGGSHRLSIHRQLRPPCHVSAETTVCSRKYEWRLLELSSQGWEVTPWCHQALRILMAVPWPQVIPELQPSCGEGEGKKAEQEFPEAPPHNFCLDLSYLPFPPAQGCFKLISFWLGIIPLPATQRTFTREERQRGYFTGSSSVKYWLGSQKDQVLISALPLVG